jgi:Mn2+/Fe2+ NRAMP family transporter
MEKKFSEYYSSLKGISIFALTILLVTSIPVIFGMYFTKSFLKKCPEESDDEYIKRFELVRNFIVVSLCIFEIVLLGLLYKIFGLNKKFVDLFEENGKPTSDWIFWSVVTTSVISILALFYTMSISLGNSFTGGKKPSETRMEHYFRVNDSIVGATYFLAIIILILFFGINKRNTSKKMKK